LKNLVKFTTKNKFLKELLFLLVFQLIKCVDIIHLCLNNLLLLKKVILLRFNLELMLMALLLLLLILLLFNLMLKLL